MQLIISDSHNVQFKPYKSVHLSVYSPQHCIELNWNTFGNLEEYNCNLDKYISKFEHTHCVICAVQIHAPQRVNSSKPSLVVLDVAVHHT